MTTVTTPVTIALSKGRIFEETVPLLAAAGIEVTEDVEKSRKLIFDTNQPNVRVVLVRACALPPSTPKSPATSLPKRACTWTWSSCTAPWSWRR